MDRKIKLVIPQIPESYNVIKNWHWAKKDEYNRLWYDEVSLAWTKFCKNGKEHSGHLGISPSFMYDLPLAKAKIDFYIFFSFKHRRDKLNYALGLKPALDQIATEGIIIDDNWERIDDQYYSRIDKINPRTEVLIEELNEDP